MNYTTAKKQWEYKWQMKQDGTTGESEVFSSFNTAQMVEWHEMGCFISNPLIRRVEVKEKDDDEKETVRNRRNRMICRMLLMRMLLMLLLMKKMIKLK